MSDELKYSERMREVDVILNKIRVSDDVDDAISLFEVACDHLKKCKDKIDCARGKYEEIISKSEN